MKRLLCLCFLFMLTYAPNLKADFTPEQARTINELIVNQLNQKSVPKVVAEKLNKNTIFRKTKYFIKDSKINIFAEEGQICRHYGIYNFCWTIQQKGKTLGIVLPGIKGSFFVPTMKTEKAFRAEINKYVKEHSEVSKAGKDLWQYIIPEAKAAGEPVLKLDSQIAVDDSRVILATLEGWTVFSENPEILTRDLIQADLDIQSMLHSLDTKAPEITCNNRDGSATVELDKRAPISSIKSNSDGSFELKAGDNKYSTSFAKITDENCDDYSMELLYNRSVFGGLFDERYCTPDEIQRRRYYYNVPDASLLRNQKVRGEKALGDRCSFFLQVCKYPLREERLELRKCIDNNCDSKAKLGEMDINYTDFTDPETKVMAIKLKKEIDGITHGKKDPNTGAPDPSGLGGREMSRYNSAMARAEMLVSRAKDQKTGVMATINEQMKMATKARLCCKQDACKALLYQRSNGKIDLKVAEPGTPDAE